MIIYKSGSIFDSTADCLINPVNCVGVMGAGLALDFKRRYPDMFKWYATACKKMELYPGQIAFWAPKTLTEQRCICLFPTKFLWHELSTVTLIDAGLKKFLTYAPLMKINSAAFPKLGCGLGGLNFEKQIQPLMERHFAEIPLQIEVYV